MEGLILSKGWMVVLPTWRNYRSVVLGLAVLVAMITADTPVATDGPSLRPTALEDSEAPSWTPSAIVAPQTEAPERADPTTTTAALPSARNLTPTPTLNYGHRTVNETSSSSKDALASPVPVSSPPLRPSQAGLGDGPARLSREVQPAGSGSKSTLSPSPLSNQQLLHTQSNNSSTSTPSLSTSAGTPLSARRPMPPSDQRAPDGPPPPAADLRNQSEQILTIMTSRPVHPLPPPRSPVDELQSNPVPSQSLASEGPGDVSAAPSSPLLDRTQLSPSRDPAMPQDAAQGIHLLLEPPGERPPSSSMPLLYASSSSSSSAAEPTPAPPEDFFPTNTMEGDWGSGDYLETMSFLGSEGDDFSLVTSLPSDMFDLEDSDTESYDTSFPSRVGVSPSSRHHHHAAAMSPGLTAAPPTSIRLSPSSSVTPSLRPSRTPALEATPTTPRSDGSSDTDWSDAFAVGPTDLLLPDMNSLEFSQADEDGAGSAERGGDVTASAVLSLAAAGPTRIVATGAFAVDPGRLLTASYGDGGRDDNSTWVEEEVEEASGDDVSGSGLSNATAAERPEAAVTPQLANVSEVFLEPSVAAGSSVERPSSVWVSSGGDWSSPVALTPTPTEGLDTSFPAPSAPPSATSQSDDVTSSSSLTDVLWFVSSTMPETLLLSSTSSLAFTPLPTVISHNISSVTTEPSHNATSVAVTGVMADQAATTDAVTSDSTVTNDSFSTVDPTLAATTVPATEATTTITSTNTTTTTSTTNTEASTSPAPTTTTATTPVATPPRHYLCNVTNPAYLVRVGFPSGATVGYAKSQMRDILKSQFNRSLELQVVESPPRLVFRAVSGPVVYTAISVINALRQSGRRFLSLAPNWTTPDHQYQVHSVLQFVPSHIDVRVCNFSERMEKGLTMAYAEVRRRARESTNFTVQIVNITVGQQPRSLPRQQREQVDITFAVRDAQGYLRGSEVSSLLRKLNMVEFSYYLGFPVLQIAEPFHYPELNTTQLLRSSWVRTVLLGVLEQGVGERTFQAKMERGLALLLGESLGTARRSRRATSAGNNSVQMVSASRLVGPDQPLEMVYFVEGPSGERLPAVTTATMLNSLDVQRAAIVLGYRVQGILAQPVEKVSSPPTDNENTNLWIIIGVVVPLIVVVVIISILYWKLCRTDKLEFQPDAMTSVPQRQKLQAPSVKGFDFAKLHLGQHSKDDIMVIQEPAPLPSALPSKEAAAPENGEVPTPRSKNSTSSAKASRGARRRGRISPSDGDSVVSDRSSERESTEENLRGVATPGDSKHARKIPINVLNGPPPLNGHPDQQLSSASIFEHVDRMSRPADANRRLTNKIQLIAMQPMPVPPFLNPVANGRAPDSNNLMNKEIQVALRHKSEIEHHRNKIRLRAKRKGHYDFPVMEDLADGPEQDQDRLYHKAQQQIDKILDPDIHMPSLFTEPKKSGRGKRSPKQRKRQQLNGGLTDADKDQLITNDSDGTYRKYPGVNNVAYVSDPDQAEPRSPSPLDDVFLGPASPPPGHAPPPPPYMPPQPSIEEARQQMHSLLDDAFALVSPTSQGSTAGITLPGVGVSSDPPSTSPPGRGPRAWPPSYPALSPFSGRYADLGMSPPSAHGLLQRQGLGSGYLPPGDAAGSGEALQPDSLYSSRGLYPDELPSSARPRPVGGSTGAQLHHLTQVGLSNRINGYAGGGRPPPGQNGGSGWSPYADDDFPRLGPSRDALLGYPDYPSCSLFQTPRLGPSAPPAHLDTPGLGYPSSSSTQEQSPPPNHSSASLIKAIREELLRLSQKQAAVSSYHS